MSLLPFVKRGDRLHLHFFSSEEKPGEEFKPCAMVFGLKEVAENPDYETNGMKFKFVSSEGKAAWDKNKSVSRSNDANAVTNHACLVAMGANHRIAGDKTVVATSTEPKVIKKG